MKHQSHHSDDFDQFMADMKRPVEPDRQFKDALKSKLHENYYKTNWMISLRETFSSKLFLSSAGSLAVLLIIFSVFGKHRIVPGTLNPSPTVTSAPTALTDGWLYSPQADVEDSYGATARNFSYAPMAQQGVSMKSAAEANIGFATGGAKDINNFRENIKNGYLPLLTDITYEGLYYDYFFDTGKQEACADLFCPSYAYAVSRDPYSNQNEYYMTVGLNSGIKEKDFQRKKLNLIVVLDMSGSMGSSFDSYYYDGRQNMEYKDSAEDMKKTKMTVANEAVAAMLDHLGPEDRFGMVLFDDQAYEAKKVGLVGETNMDAIKKHILEVRERGGTNHEAGYKAGYEMMTNAEVGASEEYENRIIFLTDAMPNTGATDVQSLLGMVNTAEAKKIYTTFIGVGIDFNSELIENISKVRGANYYSVHSSREFKKRLDTEFDFMVTPLVFDLSLDFTSDGWEIEHIYGSPDTDAESGQLMHVRTLFPSSTEGGETKGGVVLLKLRKKMGTSDSIRLTASYGDRSGKSYTTNKAFTIPSESNEYYANTGIRKAILLTRYANLMKYFITIRRATAQKPSPYSDFQRHGIIVMDDVPLGEWERTSVALNTTEDDKKALGQFKDYFEGEMVKIDDDSLGREIVVINTLTK